jgi:hypothetical protein
MQLKNNHIFPTSAALALGCLMGHTDVHPCLDVIDDDLVWQLVQAMEVTLQGKAFPVGSELYYTSWFVVHKDFFMTTEIVPFEFCFPKPTLVFALVFV